MAAKGSRLPLWIRLWLWLSGIICTIDTCFNLLKPKSLTGHEFGGIYYLWNIYADVDLRYGTPDDVVALTIARLMTVEIVFNFIALIMNAMDSPHTVVTTFFTTVLVFWKTCVFCGFYAFPPLGSESAFSPDASDWKIFWVFWVMNGFWLWIPFLIIIYLWPLMVEITEVNTDLRNSRRKSTIQ